MAATGLLDSFLAAIQASLSVLLVISYGGLAAHLQLLTPANTKAISKVCVRMFLPALLVVQIGAELHQGSATRYVIILAWAVLCHLVSFLIGIVAHLCWGMPDWTTVALMFNNTTSYPLLLIAALDETGILRALIVADETTGQAVARAKSYFLVFATVSSCLTFAVGPRLIDTEHGPEETKESALDDEDEDDGDDNVNVDGTDNDRDAGREIDERSGLLGSRDSPVHFIDPFRQNTFFPSTRRPSGTASTYAPPLSVPTVRHRPSMVPRRHWLRCGPRARWWLLFIADFFNAPLLGALLGAVIGLIPPLHRAFFNDTDHGGIFTAWLTSSWQSIGGLFVPLPVLVAGVSLFTSMRDARRSGESVFARLPWGTVTFILLVRFVLWSAVSISVIYLLAAKTDLLGSDPMLWFTLMLMPTGPPAMKLITLVQVSDADEEEEMNIAKLLTISYIVSPLLSLTVVGALRASQAAI